VIEAPEASRPNSEGYRDKVREYLENFRLGAPGGADAS
jgi:hypothetical protein